MGSDAGEAAILDGRTSWSGGGVSVSGAEDSSLSEDEVSWVLDPGSADIVSFRKKMI